MSATLALVKPETWEQLIARVGGALSRLEEQGDGASWERFRIVISAYQEAGRHGEADGLTERQVHQRVNGDLRAWWSSQGKPGLRASFMSNAARMHYVWPELFTSGSKKLPYQQYMQMANCRLEPEQKGELRKWAETHQPQREELRRTIRERVDANLGVYRPDFDLKTSNHWVFNGNKRHDGFDGGVNYELYANLIHLYSDPGDTILDPFAGGGILADTLKRYRHFREVTKAEHSGRRTALMSDISPTRRNIRRADAREKLPFKDGVAALAVIDPPYFVASDGKYATLGKTLNEWLEGLGLVLRSTMRCLKPGGRIAVMTDDVLRSGRHEPMGIHIMNLLLDQGWKPVMTISNFNRNFLQMSPLEMARAKSARLLVNAIKHIIVARSQKVSK